jgi:hypothetical protein
VKSQALRRTPVAQLPSIASPTKVPANRPVSELTNLSLMQPAASNTGREEVNREDLAKAIDAAPKSWQQLRPAGEDFSIFVPDQGLQNSVQEDGGDAHSYLVREGWSTYLVMWTTGPTHGRTEESVLEESLQDVLKGADQSYKNRGNQKFSCGAVGKRNISMNGYAGREFDLTSCTLPTKVRVYVRNDGEKTHVYVAGAIFPEEDENVTRFLKSFSVGTQPKRVR